MTSEINVNNKESASLPSLHKVSSEVQKTMEVGSSSLIASASSSSCSASLAPATSLVASAIQSVGEGEQVVGKTSLFSRKQKKYVDAIIKKSEDFGETHFVICSLTGEKLGVLNLQWYGLREGQYGNELVPEMTEGPQTYYGFEKSTANKIYISWMESCLKEDYQGVGTALMQIAIEESYRTQCEGRIILDAWGGAHAFYYKVGMRCYSDNTETREVAERRDQRIKVECESALKEARGADTSKLGHNIHMYFPAEGIQRWKEIIAKKPILISQERPSQ